MKIKIFSKQGILLGMLGLIGYGVVFYYTGWIGFWIFIGAIAIIMLVLKFKKKKNGA